VTGGHLLALGASGQKQDGYIPAADQEQGGDGAEQQIKRRSKGLRVYVNNTFQADAKFFGITLRRLFRELFQYRLEFSTGLGDRNSRAELQRSGEIDMRVLRNMQRKVDLPFPPFEPGRHHTNNLIGLVNELHFAANDAGIAQEVSLPELVTENHNALRLLARRSVGGNQPAALQSRNAPVVGSAGRNVYGLNVLREVAVSGGQIPKIHANDAFEGFGLAKPTHLRATQAREPVIAGFVHQAKLHDAIGAWVRERVNQDCIDDAENGACGSDPESEGKDSSEGEARPLTQFAGCIPQIGPQGLH